MLLPLLVFSDLTNYTSIHQYPLLECLVDVAAAEQIMYAAHCHFI